MNERIKELALRVIKLTTPQSLYGRTDYTVMTEFELEKFAELIRADEREECAKIADEKLFETALLTSLPTVSKAAWDISNEIRARGDVK